MAKKGLFSKIIKGIAVGTGSVLSMLPIPGASKIGAAIVTLGKNIKVTGVDPTSTASKALVESLKISEAQATGGTIMEWILKNKWVYFATGGLVLLIILIAIFKRKRKRR